MKKGHHRGADQGSYSSFIKAPTPYFNNNPYSSGVKVKLEFPISSRNKANMRFINHAPQDKDSSRQVIVSSSHGALDIPAINTFLDQGTGDILNLNEESTGQERQTQHVGAGNGITRNFCKRTLMPQCQQQPRRLSCCGEEIQTSSHAHSFTIARTLATDGSSSKRLGVPYICSQRRAPKEDHISATLASQASLRGSQKFMSPTTKNSNFSGAIVRANGHEGPENAPGYTSTHVPDLRSEVTDITGDKHKVIRRDRLHCAKLPHSMSTADVTLSTPPNSLLTSSPARCLEISSSGTGRIANNDGDNILPAACDSKLQRQMWHQRSSSVAHSPTGCGLHRSPPARCDYEAYGSRNLGSVGGRTSRSVSAPIKIQGKGVIPHSSQHGGRIPTSSGLLCQLREGSLNILANMGIMTPPKPPHELNLSYPSEQSLTWAPKNYKCDVTDMDSLKVSRAPEIEYNFDENDNLRLSIRASDVIEGSRRHNGRDNAEESLDQSVASTRFQHWNLPHPPSSASEVPEPYVSESTAVAASECARTALKMIVRRIMDAQGKGHEAAHGEVRNFIEGGGLEALTRGVGTLDHDPGTAFNLLYILRVLTMDTEARKRLVTDPEGHVLLGHVPAIMQRHKRSAPIFRDGLGIINTLLEDPVTSKISVNITLTSVTLAMVREVHQSAMPGSREEKLCTDFLRHANSAI